MNIDYVLRLVIQETNKEEEKHIESKKINEILGNKPFAVIHY